MTIPMLDLGMYLQRIEADAILLSRAAGHTGPDASIPTCTDWTTRDLLLHIGEVHRWATNIVSLAVMRPSELPPEFLGPLPDDDHLIEWFDAGWHTLVETLHAASEDLLCWTFLADAAPPVLFWARRQAFETGVHRADAESAVGSVTPFPSTCAADGIDELLTGFLPRRHTPLHSATPLTMAVNLVDDAHTWHLTISEGPVVTDRASRPADCAISGRASDVYLALWNRQGTELLTIDGDPSVLDSFRDNITIRWA